MSLADIDRLGEIVKERFGEIDLVHVNAGFAQLVPFDQVTEEFYDRTFGIKTKGAFFTVQRPAPLVTGGGSLVFTTSIAEDSGNPGMGVYAGSRAALRAFAKGFAAELAAPRRPGECREPGLSSARQRAASPTHRRSCWRRSRSWGTRSPR